MKFVGRIAEVLAKKVTPEQKKSYSPVATSDRQTAMAIVAACSVSREKNIGNMLLFEKYLPKVITLSLFIYLAWEKEYGHSACNDPEACIKKVVDGAIKAASDSGTWYVSFVAYISVTLIAYIGTLIRLSMFWDKSSESGLWLDAKQAAQLSIPPRSCMRKAEFLYAGIRINRDDISINEAIHKIMILNIASLQSNPEYSLCSKLAIKILIMNTHNELAQYRKSHLHSEFCQAEQSLESFYKLFLATFRACNGEPLKIIAEDINDPDGDKDIAIEVELSQFLLMGPHGTKYENNQFFIRGLSLYFLKPCLSFISASPDDDTAEPASDIDDETESTVHISEEESLLPAAVDSKADHPDLLLLYSMFFNLQKKCINKILDTELNSPQNESVSPTNQQAGPSSNRNVSCGVTEAPDAQGISLGKLDSTSAPSSASDELEPLPRPPASSKASQAEAIEYLNTLFKNPRTQNVMENYETFVGNANLALSTDQHNEHTGCLCPLGALNPM